MKRKRFYAKKEKNIPTYCVNFSQSCQACGISSSEHNSVTRHNNYWDQTKVLKTYKSDFYTVCQDKFNLFWCFRCNKNLFFRLLRWKRRSTSNRLLAGTNLKFFTCFDFNLSVSEMKTLKTRSTNFRNENSEYKFCVNFHLPGLSSKLH